MPDNITCHRVDTHKNVTLGLLRTQSVMSKTELSVKSVVVHSSHFALASLWDLSGMHLKWQLFSYSCLPYLLNMSGGMWFDYTFCMFEWG